MEGAAREAEGEGERIGRRAVYHIVMDLPPSARIAGWQTDFDSDPTPVVRSAGRVDSDGSGIVVAGINAARHEGRWQDAAAQGRDKRLIPPLGSGILPSALVPIGINSGYDDTTTIAIDATGRAYNGRWITVKVSLPSSYAGGWWQIHYDVINGTPTDTLTFSFSLAGSPLHLIL